MWLQGADDVDLDYPKPWGSTSLEEENTQVKPEHSQIDDMPILNVYVDEVFDEARNNEKAINNDKDVQITERTR